MHDSSSSFRPNGYIKVLAGRPLSAPILTIFLLLCDEEVLVKQFTDYALRHWQTHWLQDGCWMIEEENYGMLPIASD